LQDWCYEAAFAAMSHPFKTAQERGLKIESKILDISQVDLAMGRVLEQGPVLVITFTAQQVHLMLKILIDKVLRFMYSLQFKIVETNLKML